MDLCPFCEVGELEPMLRTSELDYAGQKLVVVGLEAALCPSCGESIVLDDQAKRNELRFADAKRVHDRLMTGAEISAWRARHGLSKAAAAALLGGGPNAFYKYELGEVLQSQAIDSLMRVVDQFPAALAFLASRAGLTLRTQRSDAPASGMWMGLHEPWQTTRGTQMASGVVGGQTGHWRVHETYAVLAGEAKAPPTRVIVSGKPKRSKFKKQESWTTLIGATQVGHG